MTNKITKIMLSLLFVATFAMFPMAGKAAALESGNEGIGYHVKALIPENQIDDSLTYFDLHMTPGQTQKLEVEVYNEEHHPITVDLSAISASTNRNGVIDYKTPGIKDETLKIPFSEIASLQDETIVVPARGVATAIITVKMPQEIYDGVILGGLVFSKQPQDELPNGEQKEVGLTVENLFSYVIGVKLSETDAVVSPDFELFSVQADAVNYRSVFSHSIRNKEAAIAKDIDLDISVYKQGSDLLVAEYHRTGIDIAPNSVLPLGISPLEGVVEPGEYKSVAKITYKGKTYQQEHSFTVNAQTVDELKDEIHPGESQKPNVYSIIIILLSVLVVVLLVVIVLILAKKRKEEQQK